MKKILSTVFLSILLAGCVNLDYVQSDSLTSAVLSSNPAAAVYTTDGIYAMMKDMAEFRNGYSQNNTFVRQYFLLNELKGDNICYSNTSTDPFWAAATYMDGAESANSAYMWVVCYKLIYAANANIGGPAEGSRRGTGRPGRGNRSQPAAQGRELLPARLLPLHPLQPVRQAVQLRGRQSRRGAPHGHGQL